MTTDSGRCPSGRATHERSRVAPSPPAVSVPNAATVYARAGEIAKRRYPDGCPSATTLADIVREAARELGLIQPKPHSRAPFIGGRTNKLADLDEEVRGEVIRICGETTTANGGGNPCVKFGHACYRCQDLAASAIEARRATTTKIGVVVDESAVAESQTPDNSRTTP